MIIWIPKKKKKHEKKLVIICTLFHGWIQIRKGNKNPTYVNNENKVHI